MPRWTLPLRTAAYGAVLVTALASAAVPTSPPVDASETDAVTHWIDTLAGP